VGVLDVPSFPGFYPAALRLNSGPIKRDGHRIRDEPARVLLSSVVIGYRRNIMERFARLFSASFLSASFAPTARAPLSFRQFREFGRLLHLRSLISCKTQKPADAPDLFNELPVLPSRQPAFARVSLSASVHTQAEQRAPVRVYRGESRVIMVGNIEAVSRMIDRCIDEERAGVEGGLLA
jgi:hypothetical protein